MHRFPDIHYLHQRLLCFVFTGHIFELDACGGGYINLGIGLAELHGIAHASGAAHAGHELFAEPSAQHNENDNGNNCTQKRVKPGVILFDDAAEAGTAFMQTVNQIRIIKSRNFIITGVFCIIRKIDIISVQFDSGDLFIFQHIQESTVINFLDIAIQKQRKYDPVKDNQNDQCDDPVCNHGFS